MVLFYIYRNLTSHYQKNWEALSDIHYILSYNFLQTESSLNSMDTVITSS